MQRIAVVLVAAVTAVMLFGAGHAQATWSIVGVDEETGDVGVAVASCVGSEVSVVPVLVPGVGAAASQADLSSASGDRLVEALESGQDAQGVIDAVVAADGRADDRQFGAVVLGGGGAAWSGADNLDVSVDRRSTDMVVAAQGNILVSGAVVDDAIAAFEAAEGELADRLLAGLLAGADAGGDSRCGDQTATAAALLVARPADSVYAHTDGSVFGVDPDETPVPAVFVSVLVGRDGDRAPDRLAAEWANADRDAPSIVIREVDDGADVVASRLTLIAIVVLVVLVAGVVVLLVTAGWMWRRRRGAAAETARAAREPRT